MEETPSKATIQARWKRCERALCFTHAGAARCTARTGRVAILGGAEVLRVLRAGLSMTQCR